MDQIKTGEPTQNVRAIFFLQKVVDKIVFYVIIETEVAQHMLRNKRRRKGVMINAAKMQIYKR